MEKKEDNIDTTKQENKFGLNYMFFRKHRKIAKMLIYIFVFAIVFLFVRFSTPLLAYSINRATLKGVLLVQGIIVVIIFLFCIICLIIKVKKKYSKKLFNALIISIMWGVNILICLPFMVDHGEDGGEDFYDDYSFYQGGLKDKFWCWFIEPISGCEEIYKTFDNKTSSTIYLGVKSNYVYTDTLKDDNGDYEERKYYTFDLYWFNGKGKMIKTTNIKRSYSENIEEYIKDSIGGIQHRWSYSYDYGGYYIVPDFSDEIKKIFIDALISEQNKNNNSDNQHSNDNNPQSYNHSSSSSSNTNNGPEYETRDVWVDCMECHGSGKCKYCQGAGKDWYGNSYETCIICHGSTNCQLCYGTGGHYEKQTFQVR